MCCNWFEHVIGLLLSPQKWIITGTVGGTGWKSLVTSVMSKFCKYHDVMARVVQLRGSLLSVFTVTANIVITPETCL
jgi:hypothetical protein